MSRGAWIVAALAFGFIALLMIVMARSLDTKAPIRFDRAIDRGAPPPSGPPTEAPLTAAEVAAREEQAMRSLVERRAPSLASRAAAQVFASEDLARARCSFSSATLVHRDAGYAYWRLDYSCADAAKPDDLPNLTGVSMRLRWDGERWMPEP